MNTSSMAEQEAIQISKPDAIAEAAARRRTRQQRERVIEGGLFLAALTSVATTVTIGSVAYPMLAKAGYEKNAAGGLLAAGGLGAILSPPVLGAAAFLIAEFLKISYLDVIVMATVPTLLYYFSLFIMVELDARKYGMGNVPFELAATAWQLAKRYWFHFASLISIIVFMLMGFSPTLSVFWATVVALLKSKLRESIKYLLRRWILLAYIAKVVMHPVVHGLCLHTPVGKHPRIE